MHNIKNVRVTPGCITCGTCAFTAPEIFEVTDVSRVKPHADIQKYEDLIREAIKRCPVQVIKSNSEE